MDTGRETELARRRYDRVARLYDYVEAPVESLAFRRWRELLWSGVRGKEILEVGVGTGKNIPFYPAAAQVTAIDLSPGMLKRARERANQWSGNLRLLEMDVEDLRFSDHSFDAVVGSFVFCSVPDPISGLREIRRVLRPEGTLHLLEHVLSTRPLMPALMNALNRVVVRMQGVNINRRTADNIRAAGFFVESETDLWWDIFKLFVGKPA